MVEKNGYASMFRSAYVDRWGHCSFNLAEWLVAIETMKIRLDTGDWPSLDPKDLNDLGVSLDSTSTSRFCKFKGVEKYNHTWVPTVADYLGEK